MATSGGPPGAGGLSAGHARPARRLRLAGVRQELRRVHRADRRAGGAQITGTTFATTKPSSVDDQVFGCDYSTGDSALLQVSVATQDGKGVYDSEVSALTSVGGPPTPVKGVGDEAFFDTSPGASTVANYGAVFGDVYIKIGGLTPVTAAQGKQIVEELHAKL